MAGSKRMSAEEKRKAILEIYHKTKEVFTEKEIVSLASKAGVNANTIVDVNASLVDDGLVEKDKIGGSNFFWSFPGKRDRMLQLDHERVLAETELAKGRIAEAEAKLADAKRGREDEDGERPKKLAKLIELGKKKEQLLKELETLKANDPQSLADSEKELKLVREGAERWTDNIFKCKSYLTKKRGLSSKDACKMLGVTSEFDYPEYKIPSK